MKLNYQTNQCSKAKTKEKLIFTNKKHEDHFPINQILIDEIIKKIKFNKEPKKTEVHPCNIWNSLLWSWARD